jgi:hypothetical protein
MDETMKKRWLRIAMITAIVLGLLILILAITHNAKKNSPGHDTRTYDKYSGETVSNINGKTPETYGQASSQPLWLGFDLLISHGFTQDQLTAIQTGYQQYFTQNKLKITQVSLYKATYKDMYKTELETPDLDNVTLRLFNPAGKQVFSYSSSPDGNGPSGN